MSSININNILNITKVFAIISVIMAHSRSVNYPFLSIITERLGAIGVITFLIIGGYYFNIDKYGFTLFFKNKVKTILIPWVFTGTLVYLVGLKFDFLDWLLWIIGFKTYLYYLTIIMLCYLVISQLNTKKWLLFFVILNVISLLATSFGWIDLLFQYFFHDFIFYNYLNIFNWIGFFSMGVLLKNKMENLVIILNKNILVLFISFVIILIASVYVEPTNGGYFSKLAFLIEFFGFLVILAFSSLKIFDFKFMYKIASLTFAIYLIHFLTFPFRKFLFVSPITEFVNPIILMLIATLLLLFGMLVSKKLKLNSIYCLMLGIRDNNK